MPSFKDAEIKVLPISVPPCLDIVAASGCTYYFQCTSSTLSSSSQPLLFPCSNAQSSQSRFFLCKVKATLLIVLVQNVYFLYRNPAEQFHCIGGTCLGVR